MILYCNFEELAALNAAVTRALEAPAGEHPVVAPPQAIADLEMLLPRLIGDLTVESLADQAALRRAVSSVTDDLRCRLDAVILDQHPAAEDAVLAYFDFAHALSVLDRLDAMGREMAAIAEVMTGQAATSEAAQRFTFSED